MRLHAVQGHGSSAPARALDPVCGMAVDAEPEPVIHVWRDRSYVFCSRACGVAFLTEPDRYVDRRR